MSYFFFTNNSDLLAWPSTMEALNPATPYTPKSAIPSLQSPSPSPSPLAASSSRLWRPTAQWKLRNQWSKLASLRQEWASSSSTVRLNAMSLVNAHPSMKYLASMELGVLSDMTDIRKKASQKLLRQQVVTSKQASTWSHFFTHNCPLSS